VPTQQRLSLAARAAFPEAALVVAAHPSQAAPQALVAQEGRV
jgi:hypothetical protein